MNLYCKIISKFTSLGPYILCMGIIIASLTNDAFCQSGLAPKSDSILRTVRVDTLKPAKDSLKVDSLSLMKDSTTVDSVALDSSKNKQLEQSLGIRISKDALPSVVKAESVDSTVLDMRNNRFYLYGKAKVNYEDMQLDAGKIEYEQAKNIVKATPALDSAGVAIEKPDFTQGKETFTYDSMQYNFKSKRAIVKNVKTQYGEGFMLSQQVKRNPDQSVYGFKSVYTTCALDTPHFGILARKVKVIPGKVIATGPANITIEGVPTPLWLPFGLFPVSQKQRSGFVIPTYTIEEARGLGLLNGGYYMYLNDHVDAMTQANIFTKGSYGMSELINYSDIYHFKGNIFVSYASNKTGEDFEPGASTANDFAFRWSHQTDAKARPGQNFNVSVNIASSTYYSNNSYDPNQILQNQLSSNISYSKNWIGTPFSLTISALHSQNTLSRQVNVTLPSANFHVNGINPFQRKNSIGTHWYDKITLSYTADLQNRTTFYDSSFSFSKLNMKQFQNGIHHSVPVSASYTVLRFMQMSFNVNYNEYWLTDKIYQHYDDIQKKIDSVDLPGFYAIRDFSAGVSFSSRIYGMKLFKTGRLRGIRHVLTPSLGYTFRPDFGSDPFNYYYRARLDTSQNYQYVSPYQSSIVGFPANGKQGLINMSLNNNLQIKMRSSKDTVTGYKNVTLIDGLGISTSYNTAADSFRWSNIGLNFRTNIMDKVQINATSSYDPYAFDYQYGRRLQQTMWDKGQGLARFQSASVSLGSNFHSAPLNSAKNPTATEEYSRVLRSAGYSDYVDMNIPWSLNLSYQMNVNKTYSYFSKSDTTIVSQNITIQGDVNLTERWKLTLSTNYNFTEHQLGLTQIHIFRDLHCWQMDLSTIPFGPKKSYTFTLNVKATVLQDLKLLRRRDYRDAAQ